MFVDAKEKGQSAALIALLAPVLIIAVALVVDVGNLYAAKRWGQSVVDSAAVNAALVLDDQKFADEPNRVVIDSDGFIDAACGSWFTTLRANGGAFTYDQVPEISSCNATLVGDRGVEVTANVTVPGDVPLAVPGPLRRAGAGRVGVDPAGGGGRVRVRDHRGDERVSPRPIAARGPSLRAERL